MKTERGEGKRGSRDGDVGWLEQETSVQVCDRGTSTRVVRKRAGELCAAFMKGEREGGWVTAKKPKSARI